MSLFAHHAEAMIAVEVYGRNFPDGMTEHAVAAVAGAVLLAAVGYGVYAAARDLLRWRRAAAAPAPAGA